jgi:hypothetical protein
MGIKIAVPKILFKDTRRASHKVAYSEYKAPSKMFHTECGPHIWALLARLSISTNFNF